MQNCKNLQKLQNEAFSSSVLICSLYTLTAKALVFINITIYLYITYNTT